MTTVELGSRGYAGHLRGLCYAFYTLGLEVLPLQSDLLPLPLSYGAFS